MSWKAPPSSRGRRGGGGGGGGRFAYTTTNSPIFSSPSTHQLPSNISAPEPPRRRPPMIRKPATANSETSLIGLRILFVHKSKRPLYLQHARLYYELFQQLGEVSTIDFERKQGVAGPANGIRVTFIPPPSQPFWFRDVVPCVRTGPGGRLSVVEFHAKFLSNIHLKAPIPSPIRPQVFYPALLEAPFSAINFGIRVQPTTIMIMETFERDPGIGGPMRFRLELGRSPTLFVEFSLPDATNKNPQKSGNGVVQETGVEGNQGPGTGANSKGTYIFFQISINISRLDVIYYKKGKSLVIPLDHPPKYFERANRPDPLPMDEAETSWRAAKLWARMTHLPLRPEGLPLSRNTLFPTSPVTLYDKNARGAMLGEWTTYQFDLDLQGQDLANFEMIIAALSDYGISIATEDKITYVPEIEPSAFNDIDLPSTGQTGKSNEHDIAQFGEMLPFCVRYQLDVCLASRNISRYTVTPEFISKLCSLPGFQAQDILEKAFYSKRQFHDPMEIFKEFHPRRFPLKVSKHCHLSRSVTITPTTMYLQPATIEISNRVIRKYGHLSDNFIRVKFSDEKGMGRLFLDHESGRQVYDRISRALKNGIGIGDFVFEFLAWGSSQLREHGAYCFRPAGGVTASSIREWMGDFSQITNVAKHASRLSLAFSTTRQFSGFKVTNTEITDYEHKGYNFSDGVGKMSLLLAQMVGKSLGLPDPLNDPPSVVQFRYGGHKGVMAVDPTLAQYSQISTRPSQNKFKYTEIPVVEVTRVSSYAAAQLNRQLIAVLSCLGIDDSVFTGKMKALIVKLAKALTDKDVATQLLRRNVDHNQSSIALANLIEDGFMDSHEPFLMTCLYLWRAWVLKFLKDKAHIFIENGAFLLGCVDETGKLQGHFNEKLTTERSTLQEKIDDLPQIFIQVGIPERDSVTANYKIMTGLCIIARNPALHPGDIRVVNAVDIPELRHLKNVVVLPQSGDRPISNMCAGGDLDGDDYIVIWDRDLIFDEWNVEPMSYVGATPPQLTRPVQVNDTVDFFIHYMQKDKLASIALAHLAHSDNSYQGAKSPMCLRLAQLHSDAVDFAKTGVPAPFTNQDNPQKWPHFMERFGTSYKSESVLGQLYDMVESVKFTPDTDFQFNPYIASVWKSVLSPARWEEFKVKAATMKDLYDSEIKRIQSKYQVETELEIWTVFCLAHTTEKGSYKFSEVLGDRIQQLKDDYRQFIYEDAGVSAENPDYSILGPYIAAMYEVTSESAIAKLAEIKIPHGFDVISSDLDHTSDDIETETDGSEESSNTSPGSGFSSESINQDPIKKPATSPRSPREPLNIPASDLDDQVPIPAGRIFAPNQIPYISFPWLFPTELGTMAMVSSASTTVSAVKLFEISGIVPENDYARLVYTLNNLRNRTRTIPKGLRKVAQPSFSWTNSSLSDALATMAKEADAAIPSTDIPVVGVSTTPDFSPLLSPLGTSPKQNDPVQSSISAITSPTVIASVPLSQPNRALDSSSTNSSLDPFNSMKESLRVSLPSSGSLVAEDSPLDGVKESEPRLLGIPDSSDVCREVTVETEPSTTDGPDLSSSAAMWSYPGADQDIDDDFEEDNWTNTAGSLSDIYSRLQRNT